MIAILIFISLINNAREMDEQSLEHLQITTTHITIQMITSQQPLVGS